MSYVLSALDARRSAKKLTTPAPSKAELEQILRAGANAPDHGRLRPWRFIVLSSTSCEQLGDLMAEGLRTKVPTASPEQLANERSKALRAPTIIAVAAKIIRTKIPEIEQVLSAGAAVENMFLAAQALGYGAMWKTGDAAYSPQVKQYLGLAPEDHIVAFLYIGTLAVPTEAPPVSLDGLVSWR